LKQDHFSTFTKENNFNNFQATIEEMKMGEEYIKIRVVEDGASTSWADEMEEVVPAWEDPRWSKAEVKQVKKKVQQVKKKVARALRVVTDVVKPEKTYSHLFPLGDYLAMVLGEKGMENLRRDGGARSKEGLEEKYVEQMMRKPGVCKNPSHKNYMAFDVEKLEEEPLQRRIFEMESRPQIVTDEQGRHYVVLLGMGPNNLFCKEYSPRVKEEENRSRGVKEEVNIIENKYSTDFCFKL
jgi:hypothetical protein